jgi:hypothetical protein
MKLTKTVIKNFEQEQKEFGTKTALFNIIWIIASELLKDIGIKNIKTK